MKFLFGDIVVINEYDIGVVVKCWQNTKDNSETYDVYNRMTSSIETCPSVSLERYKVRHKYLSDEEIEYQLNN
jgi:hypothetical protein